MPQPTPKDAAPTAPDRPADLAGPPPRTVTLRGTALIGAVILGLLGLPLLVLPLVMADGWLAGPKWIGQLVIMGFGAAFLLALEFACRRPIRRALRLTRGGQALAAQVTGSALTPLALASIPVLFCGAFAGGMAVMSGLPKRIRLRLLEGDSEGELFDVVGPAGLGAAWSRKGARVTVLQNPAAPDDAVLWEMVAGLVRVHRPGPARARS